MTQTSEARRVVLYKARDGWRWRAQAGNWRTIGASEEGKKDKAAVIRQIKRRFPGVEIRDLSTHPIRVR